MIERLSGPLSSAMLHDVADIQTRAYASIGIRPWSVDEIASLTALPHVRLIVARNRHGIVRGFLCLSIVAGEGEVLSLAVDPDHRRRGTASRLFDSLNGGLEIDDPMRTVLEVAQTNTNAIRFYRMLGFESISTRRDYYLVEGNRVDALIMERVKPLQNE